MSAIGHVVTEVAGLIGTGIGTGVIIGLTIGTTTLGGVGERVLMVGTIGSLGAIGILDA